MKKYFILIVTLFILLGCGMSNKEVMDAEDECTKRGRIPVYRMEGFTSLVITKVICFSEKEYIRRGYNK